MSLQFRDNDVVWDIVRCFAQVQADDISCPSLIHQCCNPIIEGHQIHQARFALSYLSLLPPSVGFLFVFEFVQELLVHPCRPPGGFIPWYSTKQIPEEAEVCSPEVQGSELAAHPPRCSKDLERHHFVVPAVKAALELHIPHQPLLVGENKVQHSTSPCCLLCHLEKEVIIGVPEEDYETHSTFLQEQHQDRSLSEEFLALCLAQTSISSHLLANSLHVCPGNPHIFSRLNFVKTHDHREYYPDYQE
ncbi:hypothetical protein QYF61_026801 [Mycteria americana]|uniref:Uncharacterized protein n=1 Tax=Mycteria americana TaxID=33587 RepID=A0AAN7PMW5_MYCAM|nr:hypothetical protein QYF61_026801 [Mycteria americana]